jgi:hypothetical protein
MQGDKWGTFKASITRILLPIIFASAFVYRLILLLWQTYPPGTDIGFHAGVINSITQSGNTNFLWNYYQMGGGVELEFPGYHIFASQIIILTGMPNYVAQALVAALFSSFIVLAVFLVTRLVWNESVAFFAAFFVAISRTDIEILCWSGYPNIVALFLIPVIFYLFIKRDKISTAPYLISASLVASGMLLVHSLSTAVFFGIVAVPFLAAWAFPKMFNESRKSVLCWAPPILVGAILISPFLASAVPPYLNESATLVGTPAINQALLENRAVSLEMALALFACVVLLFLFSKEYKGRFFSLPSFLVAMWLLVPLVLTQDYLFGLYLDSVRFLYFLIYPVLILFALLADYSSRCFAKVVGAYCSLNGKPHSFTMSFNKKTLKIKAKISYKTIYGGFLVSVLLALSLSLPLFAYPWEGVSIQQFYQTMNNSSYQSIEWAKQNTPGGSVFVAEMGYGWWLAGVGQRPTLTDVDLQAMSLAREVSISRNVSYMLDTDYVIDNGYIQVREDGGYLGRHNPLFLADLNWTNSPYAFFQFNSSQITLLSHKGNNTQSTNLDELSVVGMQLVSENSDSLSIIVNKANSDFNYSEVTTVTKGNLFANMAITVQSNKPDLSLDWLSLVIDSQGVFQQPFNNTLAMLDSGMKVCGQFIFVQSQPKISNLNSQSSCITQLSYNLQSKSQAEIQILVGIYPVSDREIQNADALKGTLSVNMQNIAAVPDLPLTTFDYKVALQQYNVSYVANRDFELNRKFAADPTFSLVFSNEEVAIFKVEANATAP